MNKKKDKDKLLSGQRLLLVLVFAGSFLFWLIGMAMKAQGVL